MSQTTGLQAPRVYVSGFVSGHNITIEVSQTTKDRFEEVCRKLNYTSGMLLTDITEAMTKPTRPDELWLNRGLGFIEAERHLHGVRLEDLPKRERDKVRFQHTQK
jgi:hypothetical protein